MSYLRPPDFSFLFSNVQRNKELFHRIKCVKNDGEFDPSNHLRAARTRIRCPGKPSGQGVLAGSCVRAACAPEPGSKSEGKPSYGKSPGSRRKKCKGQAAASDIAETSKDYSDQTVLDNSDYILEEPNDQSEEFVICKAEAEEENLTS